MVDTALRRMPLGNLGDARTLHSKKPRRMAHGSTMLAFSKMRVWPTIACSRSEASYIDAAVWARTRASSRARRSMKGANRFCSSRGR
jgi:hypothetical protein